MSEYKLQDDVAELELQSFANIWGDAELCGPSTASHPTARSQAHEPSRNTSLHQYPPSTIAHLHDLDSTPEDPEEYFLPSTPKETQDTMPELPWNSGPQAVHLANIMDFDNLPAAPVAFDQLLMIPGVVCPSEAQFGNPMAPQRYAELLPFYDPQGCGLSDTSSNLDISNIDTPTPVLEQSPARSEPIPHSDCFPTYGPPVYNHTLQPFRQMVSTDMPPPRPTRSMSVGPHVTEPASARSVRAASMPIDHTYAVPNQSVYVNRWLVGQAQAPQLQNHTIYEVRKLLQS